MNEKLFWDLLENNSIVWVYSVATLGFHSIFTLISIFSKLDMNRVLWHSILEIIGISLVLPGTWSLVFRTINSSVIGTKFQKRGILILILSYFLIISSSFLEAIGF